MVMLAGSQKHSRGTVRSHYTTLCAPCLRLSHKGPKRAHKCGFSKELLTVNELLVESGRVMFKKIKSPTHCLHYVTPS